MNRIEHVGRAALMGLVSSLALFAGRTPARAQPGTASPATVQSPAAADSANPGRRFAAVWSFLSALPTDTETVTVVRDFTFRDDDWPAASPLRDAAPDARLTPRAVFDTVVAPRAVVSAKPPRVVGEWLRGRTVERMVAGGRNFRVASAFGCDMSETAAVFVLSEPPGAAKEDWLRSLSMARTSSRTISGRDVSVLPIDRRDRESQRNVPPWEGSFVVLLDERTIVTATSDRYLEHFLRRLYDGKSTDPSPVLQLLSHVSPDDDAWLIRTPAANEQTRKLEIRPLFATALWRWRGGAAPNFIGRYQPAEGRTPAEAGTAVVSYFEKGTDAPLSAALRHEVSDGAFLLRLDFTGLKPKESEADANLLMNFAFLFLRNHPGFY